MRVVAGIGSLSVVLIAAHAVHADRLYFSTSSSSYSSSCGSSSYSSFSLSNAPRVGHRPQVGQRPHVVHVNGPTTVIITTQRPTTVIVHGGRPCVSTCGCSPVIVQAGQCHCHRPQATWNSASSTWYRPPMVGYPGGWSNARPFADRYPGFPYSHSVSTWSRHVPPSGTRTLRTWPNRTNMQSTRTGWTLLGR